VGAGVPRAAARDARHEPPRSGEWIYEVKHDGYRMLARYFKGNISLFTRTGKDWTAKLPHLAKSLEKLALADSLLDGRNRGAGPNGR